jgi:hypothetical protein
MVGNHECQYFRIGSIDLGIPQVPHTVGEVGSRVARYLLDFLVHYEARHILLQLIKQCEIFAARDQNPLNHAGLQEHAQKELF